VQYVAAEWSLWTVMKDLAYGMLESLHMFDEIVKNYWPWFVILGQCVCVLIVLRIMVYILQTMEELFRIFMNFFYWVASLCQALFQCLVFLLTRDSKYKSQPLRSRKSAKAV
jgi:hypothetical protein